MAANAVLDFLRRIRTADQVRKTPDAELLARFVSSHDEASFAALVQRHGPMVWRLCIRLLGKSADAEDAFQAVFLVLARRAPSLSRPELLGNWLYGVAYRTALRVRAGAARRQTLGKDGLAVDRADPAEEASRKELRRMVDHEVSRLPDSYRLPVVLHYLEGHTQAEVAELLGCPCKTIHTRLTRACERLRRRLARSGLTLSGAALAATLSEEASAAVPATLIDGTIKAAMGFVAGGPALAPPAVIALAEGVMQAMLVTKFKIGVACALALVTIAAGAGVWARQSSPAGAPQRPPVAAPKAATPGADATDDAIKKELEKLQGTWILTAVELDDRGAAEQDVTSDARREWTIHGNQYTDGQVGEMYKKQRGQGFLRIDPLQRPKTMDRSATEAFKPGETFYSIYELEGDTLVLCSVGKLIMKPEDRPRAFQVDRKAKTTISYWKRKPPQDAKPPEGVWNVGPNYPISLGRAVAGVNQKADVYFMRKSLREPPLAEELRPRPVTVDEVVAAIRGWDRKKVPVADATYRIFQQIADSKMVPPGALLSIDPQWRHPDGNDKYEYRIWRIDLAVMTGKNTGYSFTVREQRLDRRIALLPSPGCKWLEDPLPANPPTCYITGRFVVAFDVDQESALGISVAWNPKTARALRVVVFDKDGNRYDCAPQRGGATADVAMRRFRLDPKKLPATRAKYFGIEATAEENEPNTNPQRRRVTGSGS
jgi:RNA polymerase sigma factor (sigma-70 family)